jgi:hypothetical protein
VTLLGRPANTIPLFLLIKLCENTLFLTILLVPTLCLSLYGETVPDDDFKREEGDPVSVPTDLKEQATDGNPLANGRVLVKTPDKQFRKNAQGKMVFAKGYKPPGGRPKGSKNRMTVLAAEMIGDKAEKIIAKIIKKALNDDDRDQAMMLKLLIERIAPATKSIDVTAINRDERTITISVEGVTIHENTIGEAIEAEVVDFVDNNEDNDA